MLLHQNHPSCISAPAYKLIVSPELVSLQNPIVSLITVFSFQLHSLFAPLSLSLAHAHSPFPGENSFRPLSLKLITSARENLSVIASFNKFPKRLAASNKLLSAGSAPGRERERVRPRRFRRGRNFRRDGRASAPRPVSLGSTPDRTGPRKIVPRARTTERD